MSRRDDGGLFLSMADVLTFLSLFLIGLTYLVAPDAEDRDQIAVDLPRTGTPVPDPLTPDGPFARWEQTGGTCTVHLFSDAALTRTLEQVPVPCDPVAFDTSGTLRLSTALQVAALRHGRQITLACSKGELDPCARLQWTLLDHGFSPRAALMGGAS